MTNFTASQIHDKARSLVEKNVVRSIQELVDFVNEHNPELISERVQDAIDSQEVEPEEVFEYLQREHNEDLVSLLEGWYTNEDEDNELEWKELLEAYHADPDLVQDDLFELYKEKISEDQNEILQYVQLENDWVARKLREQGEIVIELLGLDVWCRTCFGQAFCCDYAWEAIAQEELEKYGC